MTSPPPAVRAWAETVTIPTYGVGAPDPNPMFLEKRVYQGSSGAVYPYPVIDRVFDEPHEQPYTALFLENRYLQVMILPELGGRVQMARDLTNGYQFIYYNRVIKPALVGLAGPWISGGIEFNWPQHHRPSTFLPVDWRIVTHPDGSATVWCSEIERMTFTKGMHGFTLHPDRAYLQIDVQLANRTSAPQTFLWWANPAVHVNDQYQSVFPPDVHAVMDHGKRDVSSFPIATGTYYKVNYAPGTDISRYKNIPAPTSYMAHHSDFDFVGDYDHGAQAGMLHVADHHLVPGKKQWTWGTADFGQAWDRQLTDADGPYIELMCGAFTDNQPDFSWIMPGEEKRFTQFFLPYKQIGPPTNASHEVVLRLSISGAGGWGLGDGAQGPGAGGWGLGAGGSVPGPQSLAPSPHSPLAQIGVYVTSPRLVLAELRCRGALVWSREAALSPAQALVAEVALPEGALPTDCTLRALAGPGGRELLATTPLPESRAPLPAPAQAARPPAAIGSNEELFLNGLHLEQYRHATYAAEPYYAEALRRDPLDSRCNNAMGLLLLRRGAFAEAEPYLRRAVASLTRRNPNPYDGEPYYNLGLCLRLQGRDAEAFDAFSKAVWNGPWQDAGFFELARLAARRGDHRQAVELARSALRRNHCHHQARHLLIALLRRLGQPAAARAEIAVALALDPMDPGAAWEQGLLAAAPEGEGADSSPQEGGASPHHAAVSLPSPVSGRGGQGVRAKSSPQRLESLRRAGALSARPPLVGAGLGSGEEGEGHPLVGNGMPAAPWASAQAREALAIDYLHAGLFAEALAAFGAPRDPLTGYMRAFCMLQAGEPAAAQAELERAAALPPDYCFPQRLESVPALEAAISQRPADPRAPYYLGTFWYAHRRHDAAIACWERAAELDPQLPTVWRNLGLAYYNQRHDPARALAAYERAFALNPADARVLFELDQLRRRMGHAPAERLAALDQHPALVALRDDLTIERIALLNMHGRHQEALAALLARRFHPWEGGEGKVIGQYVLCLVEQARAQIGVGAHAAAIELLERARRYPHNLGEGKLPNAQENQIDYYLGLAWAGLGAPERAQAHYAAAALGPSEPTSPLYYNDQPPELILYQGLARRALGQAAAAEQIFRRLVAYGAAHHDDEVQMDYFAVSLPSFLVFHEDLGLRNRIHCRFMIALGRLGLGDPAAPAAFDEVLALDPNHQGALLYRG